MSIHKIVDVSTGEETLLEYTKKEADEQKAAQAAIVAAQALAAEKAAAKAAVLTKLGLTADEAAALLS
jgi:hypothetical protein